MNLKHIFVEEFYSQADIIRACMDNAIEFKQEPPRIVNGKIRAEGVFEEMTKENRRVFWYKKEGSCYLLHETLID